LEETDEKLLQTTWFADIASSTLVVPEKNVSNCQQIAIIVPLMMTADPYIAVTVTSAAIPML
jgi:hypothetical protein